MLRGCWGGGGGGAGGEGGGGGVESRAGEGDGTPVCGRPDDTVRRGAPKGWEGSLGRKEEGFSKKMADRGGRTTTRQPPYTC